MRHLKAKSLLAIVSLILFIAGCTGNTTSKNGKAELSRDSKKFKVAWSIYTGWQPWDYAKQAGILNKWAKKYGIEIELIKMDYIPSIEAYVAGQVDACVMTNMEALDMPAASGSTSTVMILGDYSNGNDALLTRDNLDLKDLKGKQVSLVEFSVSHYLLSRALEKSGMKETDVKIINTNDSDISTAFIANADQKAVVTWNPLVLGIQKQTNAKSIFATSAIPGEIMDLMVANTVTLNSNQAFGKALAGAWYEVMSIMKKEDKESDAALNVMAESAGCNLEEFKEQLKTTAMFYTPKSALNYVKSKEIRKNMDYVRKFCFNHGLLGENASSYDDIGIKYPGGETQGDQNNIQLYFDTSFMEKAANSEL